MAKLLIGELVDQLTRRHLHVGVPDRRLERRRRGRLRRRETLDLAGLLSSSQDADQVRRGDELGVRERRAYRFELVEGR